MTAHQADVLHGFVVFFVDEVGRQILWKRAQLAVRCVCSSQSSLLPPQDPRLAQTEHRRQRMGAFLVLPSLRDLPAGLKIAGAAVNGLASQAQVDPSGSTLHIAVCNGRDALAVTTGAGRLLRSDANLLSADAKEITSVVAAAIKDATPLLSAMKVGTVSVLAAAALMPVRNGFVWDEAAGAFKVEPCLQQVSCVWDEAAAGWSNMVLCLAACHVEQLGSMQIHDQ